ncbi:unnamed protein product [Cylindrotheca closterium]|uniref:Uncharacterized protein n=1 Tax=Cylindrotheca closterium TaxID=2856 RepID=A0AAD2CPT2_9STRA|nr:unnamed protein product [Cylindrotheca closterium]
MTSLTVYFNELLQSRGVKDTILINDDATVLKSRSYPYLFPKDKITPKEEPCKFSHSIAVSSSQAPCCPRRKISVDDFSEYSYRSSETKFRMTIDDDSSEEAGGGIDKMLADMMKRRSEQRKAQRISESVPEKKTEIFRLQSADADTVREVVSAVSSPLQHKDDKNLLRTLRQKTSSGQG